MKAKFKLIIVAFLLTVGSGCTTLQSTLVATDPDGNANMLDLLETANKAYSEQNWTMAESKYRKIIQFMNKDEFSYFRLGNTLLRQGRLDEAAVELQTAITLNSKFTEARHNLSTCYILQAEQQLKAMIITSTQDQQKGIFRKIELLKAAASEQL